MAETLGTTPDEMVGLDDALPVEIRRLWSESGENFSEKLQQALQAAASS